MPHLDIKFGELTFSYKRLDSEPWIGVIVSGSDGERGTLKLTTDGVERTRSCRARIRNPRRQVRRLRCAIERWSPHVQARRSALALCKACERRARKQRKEQRTR